MHTEDIRFPSEHVQSKDIAIYLSKPICGKVIIASCARPPYIMQSNCYTGSLSAIYLASRKEQCKCLLLRITLLFEYPYNEMPRVEL